MFCRLKSSPVSHGLLSKVLKCNVGKKVATPCSQSLHPGQYYSTNSDQEILHRSIVPTDHFQYSLPRLPVPKLEDTCERYLASQQPLLTPEEFQNTTNITNKFRDGEGKVLHEELVALDKKNKHTSYISGPWYDYYLRYRDPIALNHNPFMGFNDDPKPEYNDQLVRSTNMVISAMRFLKTYRGGFMEPEVFHLNPKKSDTQQFRKVMRMIPKAFSFYGAYLYKAFPLDMSQFPRLFNTSRIPRLEKDELYTNTDARHLLVMRNGNFYVLDVLDSDGNIISETDVLANLKFILNDPSPPSEFPLGVMTAEYRDTWAKVRDTLLQNGNEEAINLIDSAVFALHLDDITPADPVSQCKNFLHGDPANRWFDKCFSLILTKDGKAAVNFEHSWGDGVAVLRFFNEVFQDTTKNPRVHPDTLPSNIDSSKAVRKLEFKLNDSLKQSIKTAQEKTNKFFGSLDLNYLEYTRLGKNFLKKQKLSPDSFMQLSFQLAFQKQCGQTAATYESCSTAAFKHGRTETIRPATMATKATCDLIQNGASKEEIRNMMKKCSDMHGELTKNAAMGQGFDRHLFAMKYYAAQNGVVPDFYQDPAYAKINHIILSTSTLSSPAVLIGGFGAVVQDGYGIGYSIQDERLGSIVTCYPPKRDVNDFFQCLKESWDQMYEALS